MNLQIEDTGVGISEEDQDKLFKLFGFLDSSKSLNPKGIGLGLYICKLITEIFGGTVSVISELDKGSTFSFSLELNDLSIDTTCDERTRNP